MEFYHMEDFRSIYAELFDCREKAAHCQKGEIVSFTAMQGSQYMRLNTGEENPFRLMLVGRAVNDWAEYPGRDATKEAFVEASIINLENKPDALVCGGKDRFEWIDTTGDTSKNRPRPGIDPNPEGIAENPYYLTRSPLWNYTKEIWDLLSGKTEGDNSQDYSWDKRWFEKIVWTNLYKIAPQGGGNPGKRMRKAQAAVCKKLLAAEIQKFQPTHILMMTDLDWFEPFADIFSDVNRNIFRNLAGAKQNCEYVKAIARYGDCKVIVACRPEIRPKKAYTDEVVSCFTKNFQQSSII